MNLTEHQKAVVNCQEKQFNVRAGAGSGKTAVLVERYLDLVVNKKLSPKSILTITFTKKAAAEMKGRIVARLRAEGLDEAAQIAETGPICNFHSFYERFLRENSVAAGIDPGFAIQEQVQIDKLFQDCVRIVISRESARTGCRAQFLNFAAGHRDYGTPDVIDGAIVDLVSKAFKQLRYSRRPLEEVGSIYQSPAELMHQRLVRIEQLVDEKTFEKTLKIFNSENNADGPEFKNAEITCGLVQIVLDVYPVYQRELNRRGWMDFDESESLTVRLLRDNQRVKDRARRRYQAILVDESQDLNWIQHQLLKQLDIPNEMLVGDIRQCIYAFRRAEPELFEDRMKSLPTLDLSGNFRSGSGVLAFADKIFEFLWRETTGMTAMKSIPTVTEWYGEPTDFAGVAKHIDSLIKKGRKPGDIVVLTRTKQEISRMGAQLHALGIHFVAEGGLNTFYTRQPIRDFANALEAISNKSNVNAWLAFLHSPIIGFSLDAIVLMFDQHKETSQKIIDIAREFEPETPEDAVAMENLKGWFDILMRRADRMTAWEVVDMIVTQSDYLRRVLESVNGFQAIHNIRKFIMMTVQNRHLTPAQFAENIRDMDTLNHSETDAPIAERDENSVVIMTMHAAKGLEFPVVVIPSLDWGTPRKVNYMPMEFDPHSDLLFCYFTPQFRSNLHEIYVKHVAHRRSAREEERLLYVALTRAEEELHVFAGSKQPRTSIGGRIREIFDDEGPNPDTGPLDLT